MPLADYLTPTTTANFTYQLTQVTRRQPDKVIHVYGDRMKDVWLDAQAAIHSPEPGSAFIASHSSYPGGAGNVVANLERLNSYEPAVTIEDLTYDTPHIRLRITSPTSPTIRYNYTNELGGYEPTRQPTYPNPNIIVISDYCKGAITTTTLARIAQSFPLASYVLIDTKNPHLYRPYVTPTCNLVFTPNASEYTLNKLFYKSCPTTIIKQGDRGATILLNGTQSEAVPTSPLLSPLSTVGAGDVFIAALAAILAATNPPLPSAVAFANQTARAAISSSLHTCVAPYQTITVPPALQPTIDQEVPQANDYYTVSNTATAALRAEGMGDGSMVRE